MVKRRAALCFAACQSKKSSLHGSHRSTQTSASFDADVLIGGYGIPAIPTQPPPRHPQPSPRSHMYAADCVGIAGMPYPPIDSATLCGAYCFA
ncbi:hypothetical protein [Leyella stercorea]|uniref:hypothetical protein n=1 Tax=Leyella stercorea TaxID=363265 RepID=UPI0026767B8C|nr:hypothetical protein [Leyella stercorea]